MVEKEILKNEDSLKQWFDALEIANYIDHREKSILLQYGAVLQHKNLCIISTHDRSCRTGSSQCLFGLP